MRRLVMVFAAVLTLTACSTGKPAPLDDASRANDIHPASLAELKSGGNLNWPVDALPANWNVNEIDGDAGGTLDVVRALEPSIFARIADGSLVSNPAYVTSATLTSSSPETVTYKINPKAKWSNGRQFSWQDFYWQWQALSGQSVAYKASNTSGYRDVASITRGASDLDVTITFAKTFAEWKTLFARLYPFELNKDADAFNDGWRDAPQLTAGPFKISKIDTVNQTAVIVRDPSWWDVKPALDSITYKSMPVSTYVDAFRNDSVDFYKIDDNIDVYKQSTTNGALHVTQANATTWQSLNFNAKPGTLLSDVRLRTAISLGINRNLIATSILGSIKAKPTALGNHVYVSEDKYYHDNSLPFDAAKAKTDLDALGWTQDGDYRSKNGQELTLTLDYQTGSPTVANLAKLLISMLKNIGVKLTVVADEPAKLLNKFFTASDFQLAIILRGQASGPISGSQSIYSYYPGKNNSTQNADGVGNVTINDLFNQSVATVDEPKRAALANQADVELWKTAHQLPLYQSTGAVAVRNGLANFGSFGQGEISYVTIGWRK